MGKLSPKAYILAVGQAIYGLLAQMLVRCYGLFYWMLLIEWCDIDREVSRASLIPMFSAPSEDLRRECDIIVDGDEVLPLARVVLSPSSAIRVTYCFLDVDRRSFDIRPPNFNLPLASLPVILSKPNPTCQWGLFILMQVTGWLHSWCVVATLSLDNVALAACKVESLVDYLIPPYHLGLITNSSYRENCNGFINKLRNFHNPIDIVCFGCQKKS
jgi:hypothetical protein